MPAANPTGCDPQHPQGPPSPPGVIPEHYRVCPQTLLEAKLGRFPAGPPGAGVPFPACPGAACATLRELSMVLMRGRAGSCWGTRSLGGPEPVGSEWLLPQGWSHSLTRTHTHTHTQPPESIRAAFTRLRGAWRQCRGQAGAWPISCSLRTLGAEAPLETLPDLEAATVLPHIASETPAGS